MNIAILVVITLLVGYVLYETVGEPIREGFAVPRRTDIGYATDGWGEETGFVRDMRYAESFVDIRGRGTAIDFCRAVARANDPESLHVACALGTRDGMSTREYVSRTKAQGFRFSRDDYWRVNTANKGRMDYCRILRDEETGTFQAMCAVAGAEGFKTHEVIDTDPPPAIRQILEAYAGALVWYRWRDDREDYTGNTVTEAHGRPVWASILRPDVTRGLQLNRWSAAAQAAGLPVPPAHDYLRWGEAGTLSLDQIVAPRQIRAISTWVWWDAFEKGATIMEAGTGKRNRIWFGIEGTGTDLAPARVVTPAQELSPQDILAVGQLTEPASPLNAPATVQPVPVTTASRSATYVFEIWDDEQRIMRIASPMGAARIGKWQHVVVTTTTHADWWPTWQLWIDGTLVATKTDGRMSPALELTQNFIGRGLRGCLQDFRVYNRPMTEHKIAAAIRWGSGVLHPDP
jgi:hypothetical protein